MKFKRLLLQAARLAFVLLLITLLGLCGYFLSKHCYSLGIALIGISLIVSGWVFLSALYSTTKHPLPVILLFLLICGWGIIVYEPMTADGSEPVAKIIAPLNKTVSIFFPSRGTFDDHDSAKTSSYQLLHLSAIFFSALFMFSIFGHRLINSSQRFLVFRSRKNIFWGDSQGGRLLAQDIIRSTLMEHTVFVFSNSVKDDGNADKALFEKIDAMGGIVLYRDFDHLRNNPKGRRHFFLTEDQDFNLKMALAVAQNSRYKLEIFLRTEMPRVDYLFHQTKANVDLHIINQSCLIARQFVAENPLLSIVPKEKIRGLKVDFDFNVLLIGFGWQGRELLHKTICDAQFKGSKFSATVIDQDLDRKNGEYKLLYEECIREYQVNFADREDVCNVGSSSFYHWFRNNYRRFNRIIVALGDNHLNLNISVALANLMIAGGEQETKKKLFVDACADKYPYNEYPFTMFGRLDKIYTCSVIIAEQMDCVAKAVNYVYWNYQKDTLNSIDWNVARDLWTNMKKANSTFSKDSSRAVALNVKNIIDISGGHENFDEAIKNPEMLEILSENEHLRWNAFHFTQGITRWIEIDDHNKTDAKLFHYPTEKTWLIKHACLVPYDKLDMISARVSEIRAKSNNSVKEDYKEIDRMIIRHFGLFYDILENRKNGN